MYAWENQRSKDRQLADLMKKLFQIVWKLNVDLKLHYVPSAENLADAPSRNISYTDCMLQETIWQVVDEMYGPHTVDLMATDANVMMSTSGLPLRHFTQYPSPQTAGVNVVLHKAYLSKNLHMYFRRFTLFFPVLCLLKEQKVKRCTIIVPIVHPRPVWWSLLVDYCESYLMLGEKGDKTILLIQSKKGYISDKIGLKWELRACRMNFD